MILKSKHNFILYPIFKLYVRINIKRHFGIVKIIGELKEKQLPVLLISNHISWWDGIWAMHFNMKVLHRKFHFMMLEEQLRKYWAFNFFGGFSINKKSKSIIETLNYTSELLNDNKNSVLVFPQGEIHSLYNQNIQFEKGLERILRNKGKTVQVVFLVNLIDYFSNPKPGLYMYIQEYAGPAFDMKSINENYNLFYAQSIEKQTNLNK